MKKIFALFLVMFALLPYLVACGEKNNGDTDTNTDTNTDTSTATDTEETGGEDDDKKINSKDTILKDWDGKTLNVLATKWYSENPCPPWSVIELYVKDRDDNSGYGTKINNAVLDRAKYIKDTYGVTLNWITAGPTEVSNLVATSLKDDKAGVKYHLAMPRLIEAQNLVQANLLYDMASSKYIDFDQSYYSQTAREAYTAAGHTFFAAGDSSFLDEWTTNLLFFNKTWAEDLKLDLYKMVKDGTWTLDKLVEFSKAVGADDGDGEWTDKDTYGLGLTNPSMIITASGIQQVKVNPDTGLYKLTVNDDKLGTAIDKILQFQTAEWCRSSWGNYWATAGALLEGRLLFMQEVVQHIYDFNSAEDIEVSVLPLPKLSEEQENYATSCTYMAVALCIPRTTDDRAFSEYFVDVLSWTGQEYTMSKFYENIRAALPDDDGVSFGILKDYILDRIVYDNGLFDNWGGLVKDFSKSWSDGQNKFAEIYGKAVDAANETISTWNDSWKNYKD